jgi:MFS family permease
MFAVLAITGAVGGSEGMALGLVVQDVKRDFALTDVQIGLLTGFAFVLFYALAGLAIARWADRGNRVVIISLAMAAWGICLAAYGTVTSFLQLVLLRVGLGIGEAGYAPVTQSLIKDYFDRVERPRVNAIYFAVGPLVAQLFGNYLAGRLNEVYGWRPMFMMLSLPGFAMAIVTRFTLREPRLEQSYDGTVVARLARTEYVPSIVNTPTPLRMKEVLVTLWSNRTLRHLYFYLAVSSFVSTGLGSWVAAFFVRSYGLKTGELGSWFAFIMVIGGALGPLLGGAWCSRYAASNETRQLRAMVIVACGLAVVSPFTYLVHNYYIALGVLALVVLLQGSFVGASWALVQTLIPKNMVASGVAILMLNNALLGAGLGALVVGALSDALQAQFGDESLRYALVAMCPGFLWATWHSWQASKSVTVDVAATYDEPGLSRL